MQLISFYQSSVTKEYVGAIPYDEGSLLMVITGGMCWPSLNISEVAISPTRLEEPRWLMDHQFMAVTEDKVPPPIVAKMKAKLK